MKEPRFRQGDMVFCTPFWDRRKMFVGSVINSGKPMKYPPNGENIPVFAVRVKRTDDHVGDVYEFYETDMSPLEAGLRRMAERDPSFVSDPLFKYASPDLKAEYPELGSDFGFFDAKKNESLDFKGFLDRFKKKREERKKYPYAPKFEVGDLVINSMAKILPDLVEHYPVGRAVSIEEDPRGRPLDRVIVEYKRGNKKTTGEYTWREETLMSTVDKVDDWIRREVAEDPSFVGTDAFRIHASRELKAEYPELGSDFGFFDSRRTNESLGEGHKFKIGDAVVRHHHNRPIMLFSFGVVTDLKNFDTSKTGPSEGKVVVEYKWGVISESEGDLELADDYLRRKIAENPEFTKSVIFRRKASRELKAEFPEAGVDFGFFDTKTNESSGGPVRRFADGDRVVFLNGTDHGEDVLVVTVEFAYVYKHRGEDLYDVYKGTNPVYWFWNPEHEYRWSDAYCSHGTNVHHFKEDVLTPTDVYIQGQIDEDPTFLTTNFFGMHASRKLKAKYPEAGADFGFFDATRKVECFSSFSGRFRDNI